MQGLPLIVALSLVVFRVTRFLIDDVILDEPRWWLQDKLKGKYTELDRPMWRAKLLTLMDCPYCTSAYVAAGAVALTDRYANVWMPVWTWLAVMGATMAWWRLIETPHE